MRTQRIAERIREVLSEMLVMELSDPRLEGISITDVTVDRELAYAEIYFSALDGADRAPEIKSGLEHAQGYLRRELSQRIDLRTFPRLRFHYDPTFDRAEKIERLIASLREDEMAESGPGEGEAETDPEADREQNRNE